MTDHDILVPLKVDLQISTNALDTAYLLPLITESREQLGRMGITIADNIEDGMLIEMYAAYLYRYRRSNDKNIFRNVAFGSSGMPYMLQMAINNRLLSEKARDTDG